MLFFSAALGAQNLLMVIDHSKDTASQTLVLKVSDKFRADPKYSLLDDTTDPCWQLTIDAMSLECKDAPVTRIVYSYLIIYSDADGKKYYQDSMLDICDVNQTDAVATYIYKTVNHLIEKTSPKQFISATANPLAPSPPAPTPEIVQEAYKTNLGSLTTELQTYSELVMEFFAASLQDGGAGNDYNNVSLAAVTDYIGFNGTLNSLTTDTGEYRVKYAYYDTVVLQGLGITSKDSRHPRVTVTINLSSSHVEINVDSAKDFAY